MGPTQSPGKKERREKSLVPQCDERYMSGLVGTEFAARGACEHFIQNQDWVVTVRACEP